MEILWNIYEPGTIKIQRSRDPAPDSNTPLYPSPIVDPNPLPEIKTAVEK
jgi:hypothetical protein